MNHNQQLIFVGNLLRTIEERLVDDIESGRAPESFEGAELSTLIADRFHRVRTTGTMSTQRKTAYLNTIAVNNL